MIFSSSGNNGGRKDGLTAEIAMNALVPNHIGGKNSQREFERFLGGRDVPEARQWIA